MAISQKELNPGLYREAAYWQKSQTESPFHKPPRQGLAFGLILGVYPVELSHCSGPQEIRPTKTLPSANSVRSSDPERCRRGAGVRSKSQDSNGEEPRFLNRGETENVPKTALSRNR